MAARLIYVGWPFHSKVPVERPSPNQLRTRGLGQTKSGTLESVAILPNVLYRRLTSGLFGNAAVRTEEQCLHSVPVIIR